jgi:hypothetical protein
MGSICRTRSPSFATLHGVLRFEYFKRRNGPDATAQIVGLFWRPIRTSSSRPDYIFGTRHLEKPRNGFQGSFSLLF